MQTLIVVLLASCALVVQVATAQDPSLGVSKAALRNGFWGRTILERTNHYFYQNTRVTNPESP
jgi:hypothetical protein